MERIDNHGGRDKSYWKDRLSKDLGVPWHLVDSKVSEGGERRGFPKDKVED